MIIIPKDFPIIVDLNSYYVIIDKLFEHYQGVMDSGCIYFKSPSSDGVVFFDNENLINGIFFNKTGLIKGIDAIDLLIDESGAKNFSISIYKISPEKITYWANIADAEDLHKDLSTEFTDLDGLIKKMISEKLTGYVQVDFSIIDKALIFLLNGEIVGSASDENKWQLSSSDEIKNNIILKSRKFNSLLNVRKIPLNQIITNYSLKNNAKKLKQTQIKTTSFEENIVNKPLNIIEMLQHLMLIFEKFIIGNKKIRDDFDTILKRKFMQKIDIYDFLDPFAAEFKYSNGKINYSGKVDDIKLANGLIDCLYEISNENNMQSWLKKHISPWKEKYSREIALVEIKI